MSDIPRFIFIRRNSTPAAPPTTPLDQNQTDIDRSDRSSISLQDLAAMKLMVQQMSQNPELLRQQCNIPQLSKTMSTKYQEWMAASSAAAAAASCQDQVSSDDDFEMDQLDCTNTPRASFDDHQHYMMTPPQVIKEKALITPQTQNTMPLSPVSLRHYNNQATQSETQPQHGAPYDYLSYCQECNSSPSLSRPYSQMQPPPLMLHVKQDSFRSSSVGAISSMPFEFSSTVAMARTA